MGPSRPQSRIVITLYDTDVSLNTQARAQPFVAQHLRSRAQPRHAAPMRYPSPPSLITHLLTNLQLHPAPQQRRPVGLHHPRLPFPILATPTRRRAILLPLPPKRHPALHHLLDPPARRRHPPGRRAVGMHHPVAQLENHMGRTAAVCRHGRAGRVNRWRDCGWTAGRCVPEWVF